MTDSLASEKHTMITCGTIPGLVSIILPVHDRACLVSSALESVLQQTEKGWELICVDDGSRDGSGAILDCYARANARIHVFHTEHRGVSHARNCGLAAAQGEWIAFLDDDDWYEPDFLEVMLRYTKDPDTDVICCGVRKEDSGRPKEPGESVHNCPDDLNCLADAEGVRVFEGLTQVLQAVLDSDNDDRDLICTVWGKLYRHTALQKSFDESLLREEDFCYNLDNRACFRRLVRLPERLYHYYISQKDSLNHTFYIGQPQMLRSWMERATHADIPLTELEGLAGIYKYRICQHFMALCLVSLTSPSPQNRENLLLAISLTLTDDLFDVISSVPDTPPKGHFTEEIPFDQLWELLKSRETERIANTFWTYSKHCAALMENGKENERRPSMQGKRSPDGNDFCQTGSNL